MWHCAAHEGDANEVEQRHASVDTEALETLPLCIGKIARVTRPHSFRLSCKVTYMFSQPRSHNSMKSQVFYLSTILLCLYHDGLMLMHMFLRLNCVVTLSE